MNFLPVCINIAQKNILVVGGGKVALHKVRLLALYNTNITVVAKEFNAEFKNLSCKLIQKGYEKTDMKNMFLVYACTGSRSINSEIKKDCKDYGILVNVADDPGNCDFISPAIHKKDNMSIAVSSDGKDVKRSIDIRDQIKILFLI